MGSRTRSWLLFIAAFASTSGIYWLAAVIGMNLFVGIAVPDWWLPSSSRLAQYMSWTHAMTFVGLVLVSLPIGVATAAKVARRPVVFAFSASLVGIIAPTLILMLPHLARMGPVNRVSMVADIAKFMFTLPALTALAGRALASGRRGSGIDA